MSPDAFLIAQGYKEFPSRWQDECRLFQRRVEGPPCHTNDKLFVNVKVYHPIPSLPDWTRTIQIEITGEYREGFWVELKVFSVSPEELVSQHDTVVAELIAAWSTMWKVQA